MHALSEAAGNGAPAAPRPRPPCGAAGRSIICASASSRSNCRRAYVLSRRESRIELRRKPDAGARRADAARGGRPRRRLPAAQDRRQPHRHRAARQAHFLRRAIEVEVGRTLAASGEAALVRRLRATIARQRAALAAGDFPSSSCPTRRSIGSCTRPRTYPSLWEEVRRRSGHLDRLRRLHLPAAGKGDAILARSLRASSMRSRGAMRPPRSSACASTCRERCCRSMRSARVTPPL